MPPVIEIGLQIIGAGLLIAVGSFVLLLLGVLLLQAGLFLFDKALYLFDLFQGFFYGALGGGTIGVFIDLFAGTFPIFTSGGVLVMGAILGIPWLIAAIKD